MLLGHAPPSSVRSQHLSPDSIARRWPATPLLDEVLRKPSSALDVPHAWPVGWEVKEQECVRYWNVQGPAWAALDAQLNPWADDDLADGRWELSTDKCSSRAQMLSMIVATQSGRHKDSPLFDVQRFAALAIEPCEKTTYLTVDGNEVAFEPTFVEVHQGAGSLARSLILTVLRRLVICPLAGCCPLRARVWPLAAQCRCGTSAVAIRALPCACPAQSLQRCNGAHAGLLNFVHLQRPPGSV